MLGKLNPFEFDLCCVEYIITALFLLKDKFTSEANYFHCDTGDLTPDIDIHHQDDITHYRYKILLTFKTSRANLKVNMCCENQIKFEKRKYSFIQMSRIKLCMSIKLETRRK